MTPEEWQRVRPILESALELDSANRPAFLDETCADPSLRHEIESLIAAHEQAGTGVLNSLQVSNLGFEEEARFRLRPGKRVGPYEILEEVALGGMGAVYRAIRADGQYKQQVALKIVRAELGAELTAARFRNERQILASLDHPNIAKILDGGTTADGLPYFVMECIDGLPITEFCDQHKLSIDARLKIFRAVCSAVHYAHQRLVIHRDLKPSNILVTAEGVPKLLDFGIAKILDPGLVQETMAMTAAGLWMMTPEYASPEQLRGEAVTTATDVYSLGLVLYELLTGSAAYNFSSRMPHEIARVVLETDPKKPSTAIQLKGGIAEQGEKASPTTEFISGLRGDSPEKLRKRISGDLDNIVMKAIRKEPGGRYASADQLSEDIRRHLDGLPILARKSTVSYRCRKYVLRHKVGVSAVALVFLSLLGGIGLTLRESRIARANQLRAEQRFNDVRKLANSLIFDVHDLIQTLPGATAARKLLVQQGLEYLDSLASQLADDPGLQKELAAGYQKLGDVQGSNVLGNVGDSAGAIGSYRKAAKLRETLASRFPQDLTFQRDLAQSYRMLARTLRGTGHQKEAGDYLEKALSIASRLAEQDPNSADVLYTLGVIEWEQGGLRWGQADREAALEAYRKSAETFRRAAASDPANLRARRSLAIACKNIGGVLEDQNKLDEAWDNYLRAFDIDRELLAREPQSAMYLRDSTVDFRNLGDVLVKQGKLTEARRNYASAMALDADLVKSDPADRATQLNLALDYEGIGKVQLKLGSSSAALAPLQKAVALHEARCKADPSDAGAKRSLADSYALLGDSYLSLAHSASLSRRQSYLAAGCSAYGGALNTWNAMELAGALDRLNDALRSRVMTKMEKCK